MNKEVTILVEAKDHIDGAIPLKLQLKIFSKDEALIYVWKTQEDSDYYLEIIYYEQQEIDPRNVKKDLRIVTPEQDIAEQLLDRIPIINM